MKKRLLFEKLSKRGLRQFDSNGTKSGAEQSRVETTQPKYYHNTGVVSHPGENHNVESDLCKNNEKNNKGTVSTDYT